MSTLLLWLDIFPVLLEGLKLSAILVLTSMAIGYPLGLLLAVGVISKARVLKWVSLVFVEAGRGAPILVVLYLVYYGLPHAGISLDAIISAIIALSFNAAAFSSEMIRSGLQSVPRGQREAAQALGVSPRVLFFDVVLPQGIRSAIPALMGLTILLFQATSLAYSISTPELMHKANSVAATNFRYLETFILAGLIYAAISMPATWLTIYLERRISRRL